MLRSMKIGCLVVMALFLIGQAAMADTISLTLHDSLSNTNASGTLQGDGSMLYIGALGGWNINVTTGVGTSGYGIGLMDLNSIDNNNGAASTLTITFAMTGITAPTPPHGNFYWGIGGTTVYPGTVTYAIYYNGQAMNTYTFTSGGQYDISFSDWGIVWPGGDITDPYDLKQVVTITTGKGLTSFDAKLDVVPEPATLSLLGIGLLGIAGSLRRKLGL
jgi:hypothetical protein